ncbi:MAG TPA: PadR family transcriptional regulator [Syntrophomonadaceae bacterium]|nr:PadR family transcriptional regulator [Syntrophomonadaceae bacterium]
MAKTNKTKYALLGVLSLGPGSGYDIKKFCDFSIGHFWNENYGHIYPVLKQMEAEELVTKTTEHTEGRPDRNVYFITDTGRDELRHWLLQPVEHEPVRFELILKIFFSADIPVENTVEKILQGKKEHEELLGKYLEIEKLLQSEEGYKGNPGLPFWLATINYGKHHVRAHIDWCIETLAMLEEVKHQ